MPILTDQDFANAKRDIDDTGKGVNTLAVITPRWGASFKSIPLVSKEGEDKIEVVKEKLQTDANNLVAQGFYKGYETQTQLLADKPNVIEMRARADDTRKIWRWNRTSAEGVTPITGTWTDTGLSAEDFSVKNTREQIGQVIESNSTKIDDYAFVVADEDNNVGFAILSNGDTVSAGIKAQKTDKQAGIVWGIADDQENVGLSLHDDASISYGSINLSQGNVSANVDDEGFASNIIDESGKNLIQSIETDLIKVKNIKKPMVSAFEENGDIFIVFGGAITQITFDGLNKNPTTVGSDVIFLSKKQGSYKQYIYSSGNIERYHPNDDFLKFKHVVLTGQSLAWGPDVAIDQKMVDGQLCLGAERVFSYNETLGDTQPLQDKVYETIATGFAASLLNHDENILFTGCARGGRAYNAIKKNGTEPIYQNVLNNIIRAKNQYDKNTYVPAVLLIHGEQDGVEGRTDYDVCIKQLINDYNADIALNTGEPSSAVLITCQTSSASGYKSVSARDSFQTPFAQLKASNTYDDVFLVGPKYQYEYIDHAHYNNLGTRHHGEMMAKVYNEVVVNGNDWKPLQPIKFTVSENQIIIDFYVPVGPIQFDTDYIADVANHGFELTKSADVTITDVQITGSNQVTINCSGYVPNGSVVSYAFYNGTYQKSGRIEGSRGTLKDSDNTPDIHGYMPLNNWCVTFKHILEV